jgi:hypothetical protein
MLQINWEWSGHKVPPSAASLLGVASDEFRPFRDPFRPHLPDTSPESVAAMKDNNTYSLIRAAMTYIEEKIKSHKPCNDCFRKLPTGRTFKEIWDSGSVWLSYISRENVYGLTRGDFDIAVSEAAIREGKMKIVATIVHELAHIGGAPGGATLADGNANLMAESVLKCCLLSHMFDPDAVGIIDDMVHGTDDARTAVA